MPGSKRQKTELLYPLTYWYKFTEKYSRRTLYYKSTLPLALSIKGEENYFNLSS